MKTDKEHFRSILDVGRNSNILQQTDAKLLTDDGCKFDVHKVILSRSNEYFRALFRFYGNDRTQFRIPGISGECLVEILSYLYTGKFNWTENNAVTIIAGADYLLVEDLYMFIKSKIKDNITVTNCLPLYLFSRLTSIGDILMETFRFIQTHFEAVVFNHTSLIAELPLEVIQIFLNDKSLCTFDEKAAWFIIVQWVQKDFRKRQSYMPHFLRLLAWKDIEENQAHDILNHTTVVDNFYCRILNAYKYRNYFDSSLDTFRHFIEVHPNHRIDSLSHRIPPKLHVIAKLFTRDEIYDCCEIYITYDEKLDLWHKIEEVNFYPDHIISVRHYLYLFDFEANRCFKYDLKEKKWCQMSNIRKQRLSFSALKLEQHIFILGDAINDKYGHAFDVETYDYVADTWKDCMLLFDVHNAEAVSVSGFIYIIGCNYILNSMVAMVYDANSRTWSYLPSPRIFRHRFALVAYNEKLYLIAGSNKYIDLRRVEMFDPKNNSWNMSSDLPFSYNRARAVVLNDHLYVFEEYPLGEESKRNVRWNHEEETWEEQEKTGPMEDLHLYRFCVLEDPETVKIVSKENRYLNTDLQKSGFN